jgi:hypothetical protein
MAWRIPLAVAKMGANRRWGATVYLPKPESMAKRAEKMEFL